MLKRTGLTSGITAVFDSERPAVPGVNCALHVASCTAPHRS